MRSGILAAALATVATIGLSACGQNGSESQPSAAPEGFPGIVVSDGRLVLPAVKGNPAALYFKVDYSGDDTAVIRAVDVEGAKSAMLHETTKGPNGEMQMHEILQLAVPKGQQLKFAPGGNHVMVMDLDPSLKAGGTTEVTLTFAGGDKTSFPAKVEAPGTER